MSHIFISYSRRDIDFAQKIVDALAANDLQQGDCTRGQERQADSCSVREMVGRTLHQLRDEGLIARSPDGIELLDPVRLSDEVAAVDA